MMLSPFCIGFCTESRLVPPSIFGSIATTGLRYILAYHDSVHSIIHIVSGHLAGIEFYELGDSFEEALRRVHFLKDVIENKDGYRLFYVKGESIQREADLQIMYRLTWYATMFDVNREVNNGRGPVDFKVSKDSADKTLVEFKLASNTKLRQNLKNQVGI